MPEFTFNNKDGRTEVMEGATREEALAKLVAKYQSVGKTIGGMAKPKMGVIEDAARSLPSGLKRGVEQTIGMNEDTGTLAGSLSGRLAKFLGADDQTIKAINDTGRVAFQSPIGKIATALKAAGGPDYTSYASPTSEQVKAGAESAFPVLKNINHAPQRPLGRVIHTGAEFLPGAVAGEGSLLRRAVGEFGAGALSEIAGQATAGSPYEPYARLAGGVGGAATMSSALRKGPPIAQAQRTLDRGIGPLTAGQATDNRFLKTAESALGGSAVDDIVNRQRESLAAYGMREAGAPAGQLATADNMRALYQRLGGTFNDIEQRVGQVPFHAGYQQQLMDAAQFYAENVPTAVPGINNTVTGIGRMMRANGGAFLTGPQMAELRTTLRRNAEGASGRELEAWQGLQNSLDNAIGDHLGTSNPELAREWAQTRNEYRNYLDMEKAVANESANLRGRGQVTADSLAQGVRGTEGERRLVHDTGDLSGPASDAAVAMQPIGDSGTAGRTRVLTAAAMAPFDPTTAASIFAGPIGIGRALMSRPVQQYLMSAPDNARAALTSLMATQQMKKRQRD